MSEREIYAVVPAAGLSRRMGRPKLLLPLGEKTVLARLLEALDRPQVRCRAVVLRRSDDELRAEVDPSGAWAIQPEIDPPEMRDSVQYAISAIAERFDPKDDAGWLLVPADHPVLSVAVIDQMLAAWQTTRAEILIPTCQGRRGHPTIFSWKLADQLPGIPKDRGLNWLIHSAGATIEEVSIDDPAVLTDLDTPADYEALRQAFRTQS